MRSRPQAMATACVHRSSSSWPIAADSWRVEIANCKWAHIRLFKRIYTLLQVSSDDLAKQRAQYATCALQLLSPAPSCATRHTILRSGSGPYRIAHDAILRFGQAPSLGPDDHQQSCQGPGGGPHNPRTKRSSLTARRLDRRGPGYRRSQEERASADESRRRATAHRDQAVGPGTRALRGRLRG